MENKLPDFLIIPSVIITDQDLQTLDGYVYGVVYWYRKMKLQKCFAKSEKIGKLLNATEGSAQNAINRLIKKGYIKSVYDRSKHQRELIPMISYDSTTSFDLVAPHQIIASTTSNDGKVQVHLAERNKNTKKEHINNTVNVNGEKSKIQKLTTITSDKAHISYVVNEVILPVLKDEHSRKYYEMVVKKVPEMVIREALAEIKVDGAVSPAKVFTKRMQDYAEDLWSQSQT